MSPLGACLVPDWPAATSVRALVTTRDLRGHSLAPFDTFNLGARCGDEPDAVARNRAALIERFALPSPPRWLHQVHGTHVIVDPGFDEPEADAALTTEPGQVLAVLSADCLPVILTAADGSEIAIAHAGWRGLCAGVLEASVAAMRSNAAAVFAWLGPAAGPSAYEVGDEVRHAFLAHDARAHAAFFATCPGHWRIDLYLLARQRLADAGLVAERVFGGGLCTISDSRRFYSHRRDGRSGRMASLVWIAP